MYTETIWDGLTTLPAIAECGYVRVSVVLNFKQIPFRKAGDSSVYTKATNNHEEAKILVSFTS